MFRFYDKNNLSPGAPALHHTAAIPHSPKPSPFTVDFVKYFILFRRYLLQHTFIYYLNLVMVIMSGPLNLLEEQYSCSVIPSIAGIFAWSFYVRWHVLVVKSARVFFLSSLTTSPAGTFTRFYSEYADYGYPNTSIRRLLFPIVTVIYHCKYYHRLEQVFFDKFTYIG